MLDVLFKKISPKIIGITFGVVLVFVFGGYYAQNRIAINKVSDESFRKNLQMSVGGEDPKPLQEFFVEKVKRGVNDDATKSAIYWIAHRFFDNGGNIYEIYDFVNTHPEVAFLKEAEKVYPPIFAEIRSKKVTNYSGNAILALLAYYEVIDRHGYASLAVWGMAANKYSEFAYVSKQEYLRDPNKKYPKGEMSPRVKSALMLEKSMYFANKVNQYLFQVVGTKREIGSLLTIKMIPDDLLVGLNQYGSSLQNLKSLGMVFDTPFSAAELYEFNNSLAEKTVPRLFFFTNYLYASSLVYGGSATVENVRVPLSRALSYVNSTPKSQWRGSVSRVIGSKTAHETSMYNYDVAKKLATLNQDFKAWLMKNGWTQQDFE